MKFFIFVLVALTTFLVDSVAGNAIVSRCKYGGCAPGGPVNDGTWTSRGNPEKRQTQSNGAFHVGTLAKRCTSSGLCIGIKDRNGNILVGSSGPGKRHAKRGYQCISARDDSGNVGRRCFWS